MRHIRFAVLALSFVVPPLFAQDEEGANTLTPEQKAAGWLLLFDGESTFGWKAEGDLRDDRGILIVGGLLKPSTVSIPVVPGEMTWEFLWESKLGVDVAIRSLPGSGKPWEVKIPLSAAGRVGENNWHVQRLNISHSAGAVGLEVVDVSGKAAPLRRPGSYSEYKVNAGSQPALFTITIAPGEPLRLRNVKLKPSGLEPIFNGKDLAGWRELTGADYHSKFTVTPEGWLNVRGGKGDLQTERLFGDFVFQGECIVNGDKLNSGIFFRCIPGYQQGYEYQIHNRFKDGDRRKPSDYGTGAIYRRIPARKVVPNDRQWFSMTLIAAGPNLRTWVNGYPVVDWTDTRKPDENPRSGLRLKPGHLSIQGHDPTTDLSFRNLRVAELNKE